MALYIVQHGLAAIPDGESERILTQRGRADTESAARQLRDRNIRIDTLWHSGKVRALETAEIFARHLSPPPALQVVDGLNPNDSVDVVYRALDQESGELMIVGHMPHLGLLVSRLLGGGDSGDVHVRNSIVICFARKEDRWNLEWCGEPPQANG